MLIVHDARYKDEHKQMSNNVLLIDFTSMFL